MTMSKIKAALTNRIDGIPAEKVVYSSTSELGECIFFEYEMDGLFIQITSRDPLAQWQDGKVVSRDPLLPRMTARLVDPATSTIEHLMNGFAAACLWHGFTTRNPIHPRAFLTTTRGYGVLHAAKEG